MRLHFRDNVVKITENFKWNKKEMENTVDELFPDRTTLSHIAHLLLFAELLIKRYPHKKLDIYETIFKSILQNLLF